MGSRKKINEEHSQIRSYFQRDVEQRQVALAAFAHGSWTVLEALALWGDRLTDIGDDERAACMRLFVDARDYRWLGSGQYAKLDFGNPLPPRIVLGTDGIGPYIEVDGWISLLGLKRALHIEGNGSRTGRIAPHYSVKGYTRALHYSKQTDDGVVGARARFQVRAAERWSPAAEARDEEIDAVDPAEVTEAAEPHYIDTSKVIGRLVENSARRLQEG